MDFTTDLNHRERAAILIDLRAHIDSAEKMARAVEGADDTTVMVEFIIGNLSWSAVNAKLKPAILDATKVMKAKRELDEFEGFEHG